MKQIIKFKFQDKEGFLSIVETANAYYALAQKHTPKVQEIERTHTLLLSFDLKQPVFQERHVHVIYDQKVIAWTFEALRKANNVYFETIDDSLCVLEIIKD